MSTRPGRLLLGHQLLVALLAGPRRDASHGDRRPGRGRSAGRRRRSPQPTRSPSRGDRHLERRRPRRRGPPRRPRGTSSTARSVRHHEARHRRVGHRHRAAGGDLAGEQLERRAARAEHVAEADAGEGRRVGAAVVGGGGDQLLGHQLVAPITDGRVGGLVRRGQDHRPDAVGQAGVDDVLGADDVGLGRLERVVLARLDVLERGAVEDDVDALRRPQQPVAVADVADQEAQVATRPDAAGAGRTASSRRGRRPGRRPSAPRAAARRAGRRSSRSRPSRARGARAAISMPSMVKPPVVVRPGRRGRDARPRVDPPQEYPAGRCHGHGCGTIRAAQRRSGHVDSRPTQQQDPRHP